MIWVLAEFVGDSGFLSGRLMKPSRDTLPMSDRVNPITNRQLYAEAERACRAVFVFHSGMSLERRAKLMDKAGRAVFRHAGTPADAADLYACAITADIIERAQNA